MGANHDRLSQATSITVEIVNKIAGQSGFVVLPRRWVVEHFFAWINRNRRLAKDVKSHPQIRRSLRPPCRRHAHDPPLGTLSMTFETDSEIALPPLPAPHQQPLPHSVRFPFAAR
jgi:transposase